MNVFSVILGSLLASGAGVQGTPPQSAAEGDLARAEEPATTEASASARSGEDPNERICKYVVQTGSRMGTKKCHTRAYWADMELAARNKMREIDSQPVPVKGN